MPVFDPLEKTDIPIISFCGSINSHSMRRKGINILQTSSLICKFDLKTMFWNGKIGDEKIHQEFISNMSLGHFVYCPRGAGNFSIRFYEALKSGRIPVVKSCLSLPFKHIIDWSQFLVFYDTEEEMPKNIMEFWSTNDIVQVQKNCSLLFQKHFIDSLAQNMLSEIK
jgi:hypothetical protein